MAGKLQRSTEFDERKYVKQSRVSSFTNKEGDMLFRASTPEEKFKYEGEKLALQEKSEKDRKDCFNDLRQERDKVKALELRLQALAPAPAPLASTNLIPDSLASASLASASLALTNIDDTDNHIEAGLYDLMENKFSGGAPTCAEKQYETVKESLAKIKTEDDEYWVKKIGEGSIKHHDWVKKYVYSLFKYVGEQFCFEKGAFVIKDNDLKLHNFLYEQSDPVEHGVFFKTSVTNVEMPKIFMSHTAYINKDKVNKPGVNYGKVYEIHMYENDIIIKSGCNDDKTNENLFKKKCNGKIHLYVNIKWYPFNQNNENYIFLKLEGFPTYTRKHLLKWFERHGPKSKTHADTDECTEELDESSTDTINLSSTFQELHEETKDDITNLTGENAADFVKDLETIELNHETNLEITNKNLIDMEKTRRESVKFASNSTKQCDSRREDETIKDGRVAPEKGYPQPLGENPYRNYTAFKLPNFDKPFLTNETYTRKGDEFFIPQELSEYLLDSVKQNVVINFNFSTTLYTKEIDKIMQNIHIKKSITANEIELIKKFKEGNLVTITEEATKEPVGGKRKITRKRKGKKRQNLTRQNASRKRKTTSKLSKYKRISRATSKYKRSKYKHKTSKLSKYKCKATRNRKTTSKRISRATRKYKHKRNLL